MAASNPPVNGVAFITYIALEDFANPGSYKAAPTLAAGDVKVSIDGGASANLATLPSVLPAGGIAVKVPLSAAEMTGDNIFVQFIDQTNPKEWADFAFNIQTVAAVWLAPTTPGRTLDVSAGGEAGVDWANVGAPTTALDLSGTTIKTTQVVGSVSGAVGSVTGAVGSVAGAVGSIGAGGIAAASFAAGAINAAAIAADAIGASELAADAVTEIQSGLATAAALAIVQADTDDIQTRLPAALVSGRIDASVGAMAANVMTAAAAAADLATELQAGLATAASVAALNNLSAAQVNAEADTALADVGLTATVTGRVDAAISSRLASAGYTAPDNSTIIAIAGFVDTEVSAIKAKTDNLPASPAAVGSAMTLTAAYDAAKTAAQVSDVPTATQNADALLKRDWTAITGEAARSLLNAGRKLMNKVAIAGNTLTVYKEDDTAAAYTQAIASDAAQNPISGLDTV